MMMLDSAIVRLSSTNTGFFRIGHAAAHADITSGASGAITR